MTKKLLLFSLSLFTSICFGTQPAASVNQVTIDITITQPIFNKHTGLYEIQLLRGNHQVGYITYYPSTNPYEWQLYHFRVFRNYREGGLGKKLFEACLNDIKSKGGKFLLWEARPLDFTIDLETLIRIYKKIIINTLHFKPNALYISEPIGSGLNQQVTMRLRLTE